MSKKIECEFVNIDKLTTIKYKNIIFEVNEHLSKCGRKKDILLKML